MSARDLTGNLRQAGIGLAPEAEPFAGTEDLDFVGLATLGAVLFNASPQLGFGSGRLRRLTGPAGLGFRMRIRRDLADLSHGGFQQRVCGRIQTAADGLLGLPRQILHQHELHFGGSFFGGRRPNAAGVRCSRDVRDHRQTAMG